MSYYLSIDTTSPPDFVDKADYRAKLQAAISNLQFEIPNIERNISYAQGDSANETINRERLKVLQSMRRPTGRDSSEMFYLEGRLRAMRDSTPAILRRDLAERREILARLNRAASRVQAEFRAMVNPDQKFKLYMSAAYAGLIGIVIGGFFFLAARDEKLRHQIFGGQAGIQFLTLFSLVIAIILFGIINILGDKELSALLGGISGYILGRVSTDTRPAEPLQSLPSPPKP